MGRRARRVKLASGGVAAATTLWLAGLVVGPLGFLSLPPAPPLATPIAWVAPAPTPLAGIPPLRPIATASAAVAPLRLAASILDVDPAASVPRSAAGHGRRGHRRPQLT